jgi:glutamine synthetase
MSAADLVALVTCDLGAIVRGRSVLAAELDKHLDAGVGWVPANQSLTPHGPLAQSTPFGSIGDLRLLPDPDTHVRVEADSHGSALELVLCDIVETDGRPWDCCPRRFLRDALEDLHDELGARVLASFEHEFQLLDDEPPAPPFSLAEQWRAEPFPAQVMDALIEAGLQPERFLAEFAGHQFEIPVDAARGLAAADRAVVLRELVREVARRCGSRASFAPLVDPAGPGNGVHIHLNLIDDAGRPLLHDATRPALLSELGSRFAAGILRHAAALSALSAPSPPSSVRLAPHRWSAGAVCLGAANREALLRIPSPVTLGGGEPASQLHLEYRGADATANPYLALGAIVRAGLEGVRTQLPEPPLLDRDPGKLDSAEVERYGVGALPASLEQALAALGADGTARGWLPSRLYDAYLGVKRAELDAVAKLDVAEVCRRYAVIY